MDMHVEHVCKSSGPSLIKRRGHSEFSAENMRIFGRCLSLLGSSVGSGFCVIVHSKFTIGRSALRMFASDGHALKYLQSPRSDKNGKKRFSYGNA